MFAVAGTKANAKFRANFGPEFLYTAEMQAEDDSKLPKTQPAEEIASQENKAEGKKTEEEKKTEEMKAEEMKAEEMKAKEKKAEENVISE